jgi:F0F1-type ATP synthase assembly protein I
VQSKDTMVFRLTKNTGNTIRTAGALSSVGLSFVFAIVIGAWVGRKMDTWLGTAPWLFMLFFFAGLAAGVLNVYRTVSRAFPPSSARPVTPPVPTEDDDRRQADE